MDDDRTSVKLGPTGGQQDGACWARITVRGHSTNCDGNLWTLYSSPYSGGALSALPQKGLGVRDCHRQSRRLP
ncbi:hypothetical protein BV22DRAFT_1028884 [Leucogyrophana mollusca]|uniref:Uncharacterized protein n=1 Tax=Leucogyrophana mollusca TaxID=85980 RepID=A0ACB8BVH1_9AGAM|nr:hypothetical protein BV22DRAFT_1028884 [Leucogyrophana mollusca]